MVDIGNAQEVQRRNKALRIPANKLKEAVRWIMGNDLGRFYLGHLVDESGALRRGVSASHDGAMFEQGCREMGLKVIEDVRALDVPGTPAKQLVALLSGAIATPKPTIPGEDDGRSAE
jgi:hypothetical protein